MPLLELDHYNLRADAATLEALRDFYVDVLGLRQGERPPFDRHGYWLYLGTRAVLHLIEVRPGETRARGTNGTFDHVAFTCADRPTVEAQLARQGVTVRRTAVPRLGLVQLFLRDPAGNGIELNFPEAGG